MSIRNFFKRVQSSKIVTEERLQAIKTNVETAAPIQEVHVPVQTNPNLRWFDDIPLKYRSIFQKYKSFNYCQSTVFDDVFYSSNHIIVSAPTGSGKTGILELSIIKLIESSKDEDFQIIYLAPIKALCAERYNDWNKKFSPLGISVREVTGDSDVSDLSEIIENQIIISTPEKWDSLTRKYNPDLVKKIKLFLIDEIHLLNNEKRGPVLEAVVSRMKTILTIEKLNNLRFVAVSATIPNIQDLAEWIGGDKVKFYKISEDFRPVKLNKIVLGYKCSSDVKSFQFDHSLNYKLQSVISKYSEGKPTLIFVSTRKGVEMASNVLLGKTFNFIKNHAVLQDLSHKLIEPKLKLSIKQGIAYHHAGLAVADKNLIEESFRQSLIPILLSTSTLAMGVNLPAHLVIIKSTQCYNNGTYVEYDESTILQMIGRAGRPQFDKTGTAVIMTQESNVEKYVKMVNGTEPIESHLADHLIEHLNSEIVLQTISSLPIALEWIKSTFLYVRAKKNPKYYKISEKESVEKKLEDMCRIGVDSLLKYGLVRKSEEFGEIFSTEHGKLMAKYYLNFETIKQFQTIEGTESFIQIFNFLTNCPEFTEFPLRTSEKRCLNELNDTIRFPIKGKIKTAVNKVSCLMQSWLGNLPIKDVGLYQECQKMLKLAEKLAKCLSECVRVAESPLKNGIFLATMNSTILIQCFQTRLWENSYFVSRQIPKIGTVLSGYLVEAGKTSFESILETLPRELERVLKKNPPFGNELLATVSKLPKFELTMSIERGSGKILVQQTNTNFDISKSMDRLAVVIGDAGNNLLYFNDNVQKFLGENNMKFERWFKVCDPNAKSISGHLIHLGLVGVDQTVKIQLNPDGSEETQPIVQKVVRKVKKPVVVPVVAPRKSYNRTITDFYDLTEDLPNMEPQISPAVITDFYNLAGNSLPAPAEELTQIFDKNRLVRVDQTNPVDPEETQSSVQKAVRRVKKPVVVPTMITDFYDLTEDSPPPVPEELTQFFVENRLKRKSDFCETAVSPKRKFSSDVEEEYFTQSVLEQIMLSEKSEKTSKTDEPQVAVEKSTIFFEKSECAANFDLGFDEYLNEPISLKFEKIPNTPSLLEMSVKLRRTSESEQIESILKKICDTYNPLHLLKKFDDIDDDFREDEEKSYTLTGEIAKENDFLTSSKNLVDLGKEGPVIVEHFELQKSSGLTDEQKRPVKRLSSFFNEIPKNRREIHPTTPTFNEIFKSNDVVSKKRKLVPYSKNFNIKILRNNQDQTETIFQNLTKKINQRIIDRKVEEVNLFKKRISKPFVTVPGSIELIANKIGQENSLGRAQQGFRYEKKKDFFNF